MIEQLARSRIFISHAEVLSIIYSNRGASASRVWLVWILAPWGRRFEHEQLFSRSWSAGEADQVAGAFQRIREQLGPVDLLINNASAGGPYLGCPNQAD